MKHRARPSSHTRRIKTKKGKKNIKINRHIKKKVKKRSTAKTDSKIIDIRKLLSEIEPAEKEGFPKSPEDRLRMIEQQRLEREKQQRVEEQQQRVEEQQQRV